MLTQLNPPIPLWHTTKGNGYAIAVIDYSQEHHLYWVVGFDDTGEIWTCPNTDVRLQINQTLKRTAKPVQQHYMADLTDAG